MDYKILEDLEAKINRAIQVLQELHEDNRKLKEEKGQLILQMQDKERTIENLIQKCEEYKKASELTQYYVEKEEKIKERLESMLSKFDNLNFIN